MQHGLDMTRFSFHMHASLHVHVRLMTSNLPCKALVYALDVHMMHACMSGMHLCTRCNPLVIQDVNPAKEFLTVKLKQLEGVSFTNYHW